MGASASALAEAYLPSTMTDLVECSRNFAHVSLENFKSINIHLGDCLFTELEMIDL
jgi:hypothetical protein